MEDNYSSDEWSAEWEDEFEEDVNMSVQEDEGEEEAQLSQDEEDWGFAELHPTLNKNYEILDVDKVDANRTEMIRELNAVLNLGEDIAARILRRFKWDVNAANESWFQDEEKFSKELGILNQKFEAHPQNSRCLVCYEEDVQTLQSGCGHSMCYDCWNGYITAALEAGPSCVDIRCFQQNCQVAVPYEILLQVCDKQQLERMESYQRSSFVDENPRMSWCVGGGCQNVIYCTSSSAVREGMLDVTCACGESFCFQCKSEAHRPVDCSTVVEWVKKAGAESENLNYILANTKPCPKCKRAIEKNQGCNHMVCSQCKHQFCWLCGEDWQKHGEGTGGYYSCNKYDMAKRRGEYDEQEAKRQHARESLVRYTHYFERYTAHDKGMKISQESVDKYKNQDGIEYLSEKLKMEANQVKFLLESWMQVVNCRRVLKWTYAFGFYRFDGEDEGGKKGQSSSAQGGGPTGITQEFFEFLQGEAECNLERLHSVLEKDFGKLNLDEFYPSDESPNELTQKQDEFKQVKQNLVRLTDITKNYFQKLVRALERGVDTVQLQMDHPQIFSSPSNSQEIANIPNIGSNSMQKIPRENGENSRKNRRLPRRGLFQSQQQKQQQEFSQNLQQQQLSQNSQQQQQQQQVSDNEYQQQMDNEVIDLTGQTQMCQNELERLQGGWQCPSCTLINRLDDEVCEVCLAARPMR